MLCANDVMTSGSEPVSAVVDIKQTVSGFLVPRGNPIRLCEAVAVR